MAFTDEQINLYTSRRPLTKEQEQRQDELRNACRFFLASILRHAPSGMDATRATIKGREALMWALEAVANGGR